MFGRLEDKGRFQQAVIGMFGMFPNITIFDPDVMVAKDEIALPEFGLTHDLSVFSESTEHVDCLAASEDLKKIWPVSGVQEAGWSYEVFALSEICRRIELPPL